MINKLLGFFAWRRMMKAMPDLTRYILDKHNIPVEVYESTGGSLSKTIAVSEFNTRNITHGMLAYGNRMMIEATKEYVAMYSPPSKPEIALMLLCIVCRWLCIIAFYGALILGLAFCMWLLFNPGWAF